MEFLDQLAQSLDARLKELGDEIAALHQARDALATNGAAAPAPPPREPQPVRRRARTRAPSPSVEVAPVGKLRRLLAESDGLTTAELADNAKADPAQILPLLREMETSGEVMRQGQRRGTRWYAVSNQEEWIERRAAELAARSRA